MIGFMCLKRQRKETFQHFQNAALDIYGELYRVLRWFKHIFDKNHLLPCCGYNNEAGCQGAVFLLACFLIQLYFELWLCITLHRI